MWLKLIQRLKYKFDLLRFLNLKQNSFESLKIIKDYQVYRQKDGESSATLIRNPDLNDNSHPFRLVNYKDIEIN